MLTRGGVTAQYCGRTGAPHAHQEYGHMSRTQLYGAGGLMGGAVTLTAGGWTGMRYGDTGYGYLGMDPSAPLTWPRPFNPAPGMIGWLNWQQPASGDRPEFRQWRWLENG